MGSILESEELRSFWYPVGSMSRMEQAVSLSLCDLCAGLAWTRAVLTTAIQCQNHSKRYRYPKNHQRRARAPDRLPHSRGIRRVMR